ncbi:MAG: FAD-dependent thymidylate synthase [Gammaproteobacteria bacterium]|nr:FAD-dependent thymidylate synthase [Gammaproteobacteria bacterium]
MYNSEAVGLGNIRARVVADTIFDMTRIITMELRYPRFIHAEFMTHRMFSRNASSSRAIPIDKMNESILEYPAHPVYWGANQAGMQARTEISPADLPVAEAIWQQACEDAIHHAEELESVGMHKQIVNRLAEPFQFITVVVTATEWDNFFNLRLHPDAQPEIRDLAETMRVAQEGSEPRHIEMNHWHLPYTTSIEWSKYSLDEVRKASVARCARVSYRNHDQTDPDMEKDKALHDMLLESGHMSPFEHQATPMEFDPVKIAEGEQGYGFWMQEGVTHFDRKGQAWSGNFKDWIQYRNTLEVPSEGS